MSRPRIEIVVAKADNGVIGAGGELPWHLPKDLRHFKAVTTGAPMIMGRKTFESLPGILPGRDHIVLTRDLRWRRDGAIVAHSPEEALSYVTQERVSVIGGSDIFREFLPRTSRIHLTKVHVNPDGDTFFPRLDKSEWMTVEGPREAAEGKYPAHTFVIMSRRVPLSRA